MVSEMTNYEGLFEGGYSSLNPNYGNFMGYRLGAGKLSSTTSMQTANQLNEVVSRIKEGVKNVEVQILQPDVAEQVPKQQFAEMRALMKLSGVKPSVHAPMLDVGGFGEKGWQGELAREDVEARMFSAVEKAHELDPTGNIPVTMHSTGSVPGTEWRPKEGTKPGDEGRFKEQKLVVVDRETGQFHTALEEERKYYPSTTPEDFEKGGTLHKPREDIESINATDWENKLTNLAFYKKEADELLKSMASVPGALDLSKQEVATPEELQELANKNPKAWNQLQKANLFLDNNKRTFSGLFHRAYKYGNPKQQEVLRKLAEGWAEESKKIGTTKNPIQQQVMFSGLMDKQLSDLQTITAKHGTPKLYQTTEEFAMDKTAKSFGNLAWKSYDKWKDNSPIVSIENWQPGAAFSRAEDLKKLVKESKNVFIENARKQGLSESAAKKQADKIIGVTWDTGHLNELRKWGFKKEDIAKETEKIAKLVKHVHLSDNFGYSDSHLAPGMGNVPFKEIFGKLSNAGTLDKAQKVIEAGALTNPNLGLKMSPLKWTMGAMGSPIYGAKMAPYWNQVQGVQGNYFGSPMAYLPEKHFSTYGSGFSSLPEELGGQMPGTRSRFSGTDNA